MNFRLLSILLVAVFMVNVATAKDKKKKEEKGYEFTMVKQLPTTSVKDQYRSGTCWSFASNSFIESEMLRIGKENVNLSEMWIVRNCYSYKAERYVRLHGNLNFAGGGAFVDALYVWKNFGLIPEENYQGLNYGTENHTHGEFDAVLKGYVDLVLKNRNRKLSKSWHDGFNGILDAYLGETPEKFDYKGKEYTPESFTNEVIGLNPDDYINVSSFTHHDFYKPFIIEVPDNWLFGDAYNVKMDEMVSIIDDAINNGFTVAWAADVSEKGFSWKNGVAIVPEVNLEQMDDTEKAKWSELSKKDKDKMLYAFDGPTAEKKITQEMRQEGFDNYQTTDDHAMHIVGIAKDQAGNKFYYVKNSWNDANHIYDGYLYVSEAYLKYKTMSFMIHKDALSKDMKSKLGL